MCRWAQRSHDAAAYAHQYPSLSQTVQASRCTTANTVAAPCSRSLPVLQVAPHPTLHMQRSDRENVVTPDYSDALIQPEGPGTQNGMTSDNTLRQLNGLQPRRASSQGIVA